MKTISDAAMTAIVAGEAIVTGAVEISPQRSTVPDTIPTGTTVELSWWQNTFIQTGGNDEARMGIGFLDVNGTQIGSTTWSSFEQPTTWTQYTVSETSPADACFVRVFMEMSRNAGTHNDGYIDDITLEIGGVAAVIDNPGAEVGIDHWTSTTGGIDAWNPTLGQVGTPATHAGSYFFAGGNHASTVAYQDYATYSSVAGATSRLWGGYGSISFSGSTYLGIGDRAFAQQTGSAIGGVAQGMTLGLSGIEPAALEMIDTENLHGATVVMHRLIFASDGTTLLDHAVWDRGRVDTIDTDEDIGGAATISLAIESAARELGRSGGRQRADSDQRLIDPSDGYFKRTASAPFVTLYWGGRKPTLWGGSATKGFT